MLRRNAEDTYATTRFLYPTSVKEVLGFDGRPHLMLNCVVFSFLDGYTGHETLDVDTGFYRPSELKNYTETTLDELVYKMKRISDEVIWHLGIEVKE